MTVKIQHACRATNDIVGDECISMPTVNVIVNNAYNMHALLDSGSKLIPLLHLMQLILQH